MSQVIPSRPFIPPALPPLQARLVNALVCRALPLTVALDAGAELILLRWYKNKFKLLKCKLDVFLEKLFMLY